MRAYMSTGAGHAEDGSRYVCGLNVESAMAEARAILADVEPKMPGNGLPSSDLWISRPVGMIRHFDKGAASIGMAEALAAFIES